MPPIRILWSQAVAALKAVPESQRTDWQARRLAVLDEKARLGWRPDDRRYWNLYARAALNAGILDRATQKRLCHVKDDVFFQALHECMVCWYFWRTGFKVESGNGHGARRKRPDLLLRKGRRELVVEVKTPIRQTLAKLWAGDTVEMKAMRRSIRDAAKQLAADRVNLALLAPKLRVPTTRESLLKAVLGEFKFQGRYDPRDGTVKDLEPVLDPSEASFNDFRNRRVSVVVCLETWYSDRLRHHLMVVHNPHADFPVNPGLLRGAVQFCWSAEKGGGMRGKWITQGRTRTRA